MKLALGLGVAKGLSSLLSSGRRNKLLKKQANFQRERAQKQAISQYFKAQIDLGQLQSALAGGGVDVSDSNLKNILETSAKASLETGFERADEIQNNVLNQRTSGIQNLLGAISSGGTAYFNFSDILSRIDYGDKLKTSQTQTGQKKDKLGGNK